MKKTPIVINLTEYPLELQIYLQKAKLFDSSCSNLAQVIYLDTGYYLKTAAKGQLKREAELTQIFHEKGFGVEVVTYLSRDKDYMLTTEAKGEDATHYLADPKHLCKVLSEAMRELHNQHFCEVSDIPEAQNLKDYRNALKKQTSENFDIGFLANYFQIRSKEEARQLMKKNYCRFTRDTLIHGDFCLPNIILEDGKFNTLIDFSMSGLGDKHIDLYWTIWSLGYNLKTEEYTDYFLDQYGRDNFDFEMLRAVAAFEAWG